MGEPAVGTVRASRRGSGILGRVGCILVLVVAVLVLGGLAVAGLYLDRFLASPEDVVRDYVSAVRDERRSEAYGLLCAEMREAMPQREFERQVAAQLQELGSIQRTEHVITIPRLEHTSVYWRFDGIRSARQVEFQLVRDLDAWRICGIEWPPG